MRIRGWLQDQENAKWKAMGITVLSVERAKDRLMVIHHLKINIWKLIRMRNSDLPLRVGIILWADRQVVFDKLPVLERNAPVFRSTCLFRIASVIDDLDHDSAIGLHSFLRQLF